METKDTLIFNKAEPATIVLGDVVRVAVERNVGIISSVKTAEGFGLTYTTGEGVHTIASMPDDVYTNLVSKIKILANLKLSEQGKQEGVFEMHSGGKVPKIAVVTAPEQGFQKIDMSISY